MLGPRFTALTNNMYNKKLFTVYKAFHIWNYYLEESEFPIDVIIDYKNLKYFSTTKIIFYRQARWLEFIFQLNLVIYFCLGCLGSKLDTITCRENIYLRERRATYISINPQNIYLVFTHSQLVTSL